MAALITTLINSADVSELVRDQIAAILLTESAGQQALATAAALDSRLWQLRVFVGRSDPWAEFVDAPDQIDASPIVNVSFDSATFEMQASNVVERQKVVGTFNIDCYGYGASASSPAGHQPGDEKAEIEAHRALRLVRNILMAGAYTYLGLRKTVWRRWIQSVQLFQPQAEGRAVSHVVAIRLALQVDFNELSPQVAGQQLSTIALTVKRSSTGEIFFRDTTTYP